MSKAKSRLLENRWAWFVKGLPSWPRAVALFKARPYTMTSLDRCHTLWDQCLQVLNRGVEGAFVECGVWRGGSAAVMALALKAAGINRVLHLFDSFEGLPEPTEEDEAQAAEYSGGRASGALVSVGQCQAGLSEVRQFLIDRLGLDPNRVHFHVGWFQNTLPKDAAALGSIALLRLDGDWYESTRICLEHLYPLLSPGGIVILDDYYWWKGCQKAAEEFRERQGINCPIIRIDAEAAYWVKT